MANAPNHCDNVVNKPGLLSEHDVVKMIYHSKELVNTPQFRFKVDYSQLTRENILWMTENNENMKNILKMTDNLHPQSSNPQKIN